MSAVFIMMKAFMFAAVFAAAVFAQTDISADFADAKFRAAVYQRIGKTEGAPIYASDVSGIISLNVSGREIESLAGIGRFTALADLNVHNNRLTSLDLSANTALTTLSAGNNLLTSLDLSSLTSLTTLTLGNNSLTSLDLFGLTALTMLYAWNNKFAELDLSGNTALRWLDVSNNVLAGIDVSNNAALAELIVNGNYMTGESAVIGFTGVWGSSDFRFAPQHPKPSISAAALPDGVFGRSYSQAVAASGNVFSWSADGGLPDGLTLSAAGVISGTPAKTGVFTFSVEARNPAGSDIRELSVEIGKAEPSYTIPGGLTATYGDTLSSVVLPAGWSWNGGGGVGGAGERTHWVTFTPADTANYYVVTGISVMITVSKADPVVVWPINITGFSDTTLSSIPLNSYINSGGMLPLGAFAWTTPSDMTGEAGERNHSVTFTPADTANYKTAERMITVRVVDPEVAVVESDRVISEGVAADVAVVAPVKVLTGEFTAGPNPVGRSLGMIGIYHQGGSIDNGVLIVYNAAGNVVNKIRITGDTDRRGVARNAPTDDFADTGRRVVGTWDLTDTKGRSVPAGAYLIRGTLIVNGKKERVSLMAGVR